LNEGFYEVFGVDLEHVVDLVEDGVDVVVELFFTLGYICGTLILLVGNRLFV
jgi:hypothetical protein